MRDDPRIANASVAGGFVHSDLPKCGIAVAATARGGDGAAAREAALDWRGGPDEAGAAGTAASARVVCDYIAGMTDRFALEEHRRLTDPHAVG